MKYPACVFAITWALLFEDCDDSLGVLVPDPFVCLPPTFSPFATRLTSALTRPLSCTAHSIWFQRAGHLLCNLGMFKH